MQEIACFSYDDDHNYQADGSSLRYYWPPRIGADLAAGFETFQKLDDTADDHIDSLLRTLVLLEQRTGKKCEADFVTWVGFDSVFGGCMKCYLRESGLSQRGMMTKVNAASSDTALR